MEKKFLNTDNLPYCKGCGHHLIAKNTAIALEKISLKPLDVVLITDIGCHGIIDECFNTHTIHGLHGRSLALGVGISLGLSSKKKKVIVFIGDGGVTIGLQHLLEAARLNTNMSVVVHNNMLYGMTGGQASGLTPCGFKTTITRNGNPLLPYDICGLAYSAGAAYAKRIIGRGDFSDELKEAFKVKGFSLVEVLEICPSYGAKLNPGLNLSKMINLASEKAFSSRRAIFDPGYRKNLPSLFEKLPEIKAEFNNNLDSQFSIILGGSAGEEVQHSASFFAQAAIASGLYATKKGSYPVTVGIGFSNAELIVSPRPINYQGIDEPNAVIITSKEGLAHNKERITQMRNGILFIDESLKPPKTSAKVISHNFRKIGKRNAAIYSLFFFLHNSGLFPLNALTRVIEESGPDGRITIEKIKELLAYE